MMEVQNGSAKRVAVRIIQLWTSGAALRDCTGWRSQGRRLFARRGSEPVSAISSGLNCDERTWDVCMTGSHLIYTYLTVLHSDVIETSCAS